MGKLKQSLYLIGSDDFPGALKIGISVNPDYRCLELQTGSPVSLRVLHAIPIDNARAAEGRLHRMLRDQHIRGEWFAIGYEAALAAIEAAINSTEESKFGSDETAWLAPEGQCPSCDKRRAALHAAMRKRRAKTAPPAP